MRQLQKELILDGIGLLGHNINRNNITGWCCKEKDIEMEVWNMIDDRIINKFIDDKLCRTIIHKSELILF